MAENQQRKKSYVVQVDTDEDIKALNENVKELVESHKKMSKKN